MSEKMIAIRAVALSTALATTSLCAFAQIVEPPRPLQQTVHVAAVSIVTPKAVAAANVKDIDQAARAPFQVTVPVNINNFVYTPVPIPAGQRLVIEYVSLSGAALSSSGPVQPIVLLSTAAAGNSGATFYFGPAPSTVLPSQFYHGESTAIYADTLAVAPAFAGYTPSFMSFNVVISGHLVSVP